ncbi:MAG: septal ring lytic transglycosylase RlpA family protein [Calditrichaeota bacterium]|nr:MAG: septal ring lytic transglycosylase RlpA family protein [Calditrichota bacterium]MBL1204180.1 septal ring lytic transglycosylase RlpA family protein [Calditrichota bacterium]NOG44010.1 septal ring lytic transglycosylase RlpA family protein [Calditrichota bacterium]
MIRKNISIIIIVVGFFIYQSCTIDRSLRHRPPENNSWRYQRVNTEFEYISGVSSYYGKKFHGRKTANGETFNMYDLTAAHKTLPFDTIIEVENLSNNKKVTVRINDRGPFVRNRILDLSFAAAKEIGMIQSGTAEIRGKIIFKPEAKK